MDDGSGSVLVDDDSDSIQGYFDAVGPPPVGTFVSSITGWVYHHYGSYSDSTTYKLEPLYVSDIDFGAGPPTISEVSRDPCVPDVGDDVVVTAVITDNSTIVEAVIHYNGADQGTGDTWYTIEMTNVSDDTWEGTIPAVTTTDNLSTGYYITATDDGVTNPYNIVISPGIVIPVGSNNTSNPSIARMDTGSSLQLAQFEIQELQTAIRRALFNDLRDPTGPVRSATEIAIESRELTKRIGSAFGRLQTEVLIPILKRVAHILTRRGLIQPMTLGGRDIEIKFTSPLARAQDAEDLMAVQQAVQFTLETAGPEQAKMAFKLEDFGTWAAEKTGMSSDLVRSQSEKEAIMKAGAEAAQAEMQQGQPQAPQAPIEGNV